MLDFDFVIATHFGNVARRYNGCLWGAYASSRAVLAALVEHMYENAPAAI